MQNQPPLITIKFVPEGVKLVLAALNNLPRGQVDMLYQEIDAQFQFQLQQMKMAAEAANNQLPPPVPPVPANPSTPADENQQQQPEGKTE